MRYPQVGVLEKLKEFSREELSAYNGKAGKPAYVGFQGVVYDVTASESREEGVHMDTHQAGQDLTRQFLDAPHGSEILGKYPIVGIIKGGQYG
ncbi:MAG: cytochrome b5 domain-containing protein [Syntrophales bacterium]